MDVELDPVIALLIKHGFVKQRGAFYQLNRELRLLLLQYVEPDQLSSTQLSTIGKHPALAALLRELNPLFREPRARQWLRTACHCINQAYCEAEEELGQDARLLDPREDYLGYKMVYFCAHADGRGQFKGVCALLHLQLPGKMARIYTSDGPNKGQVVKVLPPQDGLVSAQKYNTNACIVTGVQFFGAASPTKAALLAFQQNRGFLVSGFGGPNKVRYELNCLHIEPRAGQVRNGRECTAGLHFFCDAGSAIQYGKGSWESHSSFFGFITMRLKHSRGLVFALDDSSEADPKLVGAHHQFMESAKLYDPDPCQPTALQQYLLDLVA